MQEETEAGIEAIEGAIGGIACGCGWTDEDVLALAVELMAKVASVDPADSAVAQRVYAALGSLAVAAARSLEAEFDRPE